MRRHHRGIRTPYRVGLRESAIAAGDRSPAIRQLLTRQALAYRPFSTLDEALDPVLEPLRPFLPPLAAGARRRPGPVPARPRDLDPGRRTHPARPRRLADGSQTDPTGDRRLAQRVLKPGVPPGQSH